jgi:hypothetical protein
MPGPDGEETVGEMLKRLAEDNEKALAEERRREQEKKNNE